MIRIVITVTRIIVTTLIGLLFVSCNNMEITGSGNVIEETRNLSGQFTDVEAHSGLDVVIEQSETVSVVVEADDNVMQYIKTSVEGKTLVIRFEKANFMNLSKKLVKVKMPVISGLDADGGAQITSSGILRSEDLEVSTSSGAGMNITVEADKLDASTSSGSSMELKGKAIDYEVTSSSGSHIGSGELIANNVRAEASSGSSILVHPVLSLKGKASSGGSVSYNTEPKSFTKDESSGGSVSKQ